MARCTELDLDVYLPHNYSTAVLAILAQARFTDHSYLRSGAETVLLGGVCAAVAFFVGGTVASYLE